MSSADVSLEVRAEILKLARVLSIDPERIAYLEAADPADVRVLREQVTDLLFDASQAMVGRLVTAGRLLPVALIATIGERVFGPLLSARMAASEKPERSVEIARRASPEFRIETTILLDPRRVGDTVRLMPTEIVVDIGRELARRGEYVVMARFVPYMSDATIAAVNEVIDDRALLEIALVLEDHELVARSLGLWPEPRLAGVVAVARGDGRLSELGELAALAEPVRREELDLLLTQA